MQSRQNGQKPQLEQFFDEFEVKYLQIANFPEKQLSFKLKVILSTNFIPKRKKIVGAVFEKSIKVHEYGLIWRPFRKYLQIKNFFQKSGSVIFLLLQYPNFMQKIKKILRVVSEKTTLPTKQPIITNNTNLIGSCLHRSNKIKKKEKKAKLFTETFQYLFILTYFYFRRKYLVHVNIKMLK